MSSTASAQAPGGLTWGRFKSICADVGDWTWGMVQGAFNEKASFSQILVDAVIGMIPLVGDGTAVRDLIAVVMGLINEPKKRDEVLEWILLVVLLFALIPVIGGVVKGVGRILVKIFKEAELLTGAARSAKIMEGAQEIIAFLNRIGIGNSEQWLLKLRITDYKVKLAKRFDDLMDTIGNVLDKIKVKTGEQLPAGMKARLQSLRDGVTSLKSKGKEMIPRAITELDQNLRELQMYVRSGGETTSRMALHETAAGTRASTRAEEMRLVEDGALPVRTARGGFKQNLAPEGRPDIYEKIYTHEKNYPDLRTRVDDGAYTNIAAYSGRIVNRELKESEEIFRFFGPGGSTHGLDVPTSAPCGAWWGLGSAPKTAKEWREKAAVLDEFNRDGYLVRGKIGNSAPTRAVVGTVAEQLGKKIPGQYLPGGATQAVIYFEKETSQKLAELGKEVIEKGKPQTWIDPVSGTSFRILPTGWTDANGIWGYLQMPGQGKVQTARLAAREEASKDNREVVITP